MATAQTRSWVSLFGVLIASTSALAQVSVPTDVLTDKIHPDLPGSSKAPRHAFSMESSVVDAVTGVPAVVEKGVSSIDGYVGSALYFDGASSYVEVPVDIKPSSVANLTVVAFVRSESLPEAPEQLAGVDTSGYVVTDGDSYIILGGQDKSGGAFYAYTAGALLSNSALHEVRTGAWQMLALTRKVEDRPNADGDPQPHTIANFYVDGQMIEKVAVYKARNLEPKLTLGGISDGGPYQFRGGIDQVLIYHRALEKEELDQLRGIAAQETFRERFPGAVANHEVDGVPIEGQATLPEDQRSSAEPAVRIPSSGDPLVREPTPAADDIDRVTGTEEGQDLLKSADWRIVGMVPGSADRAELHPGDEVTVSIRVRKNDPANKLPKVRLVTRMARMGPEAMTSQDLIINTTDANPEVTRDLPIRLKVPTDFELNEGPQAMWRPVVWLNAHDGRPLRDAIRDNHRFELMLAVKRPPDDCGQSVENADGTRSTEQCASWGGPPNWPIDDAYGAGNTDSNNDVPVEYVHSGADIVTFLSGEGGSSTRTSFADTDGMIRRMFIHEDVGDRPCLVEVVSEDDRRTVDRCDKAIDWNQAPILPTAHGPDPIVGLQVCRTVANNRVKGLKVWRHRLDAAGDYAPLGRSKEDRVFERSNCDRWQREVSCPANAVATGVVVHTQLSKPAFGLFVAKKPKITGLQLICTHVAPAS